ncbi:MAG: S1C family serine protease, partial [Solirubrobacteraceae bacterium]
AEGIGFAIPIDKAKALLGDLRHGGTSGAPAAFIGVEAVTLTPALRDAYGLVASSGALVVRVVPGSPAGTAGLRPGDVVTAADGKPIEDAAQLHSAAAAAKPGDRVQLQVVRGSTTTTLGLVLSAAPLGS